MPSGILDQDVVGEEGGAGASRARHSGGEPATAKHGGRPEREDDAVGEAVDRKGPAGADTHGASSHRRTKVTNPSHTKTLVDMKVGSGEILI